MSSPSPSSSIIPTKKYDVFLSFGGETRANFTDHLYKSLQNSGIYTFRDKERLDVGKEIAPELLKAIQQSQCFVIILSENYASSGWCLEELAEIVKLKEEQEGLEVIPIFYHVDPSDFRRQKGKVGEAIAKHEQRYNEDTIQTWRNALTQVANLTAWVLGKDQYETDFIKGIVKAISEKLHHPIDHDGLVGIDSRLEVLRSKIEIGEDDVRIIGICGMGGIGKTTLAEVAFNEMSRHFEGKCFIYDVRDKSGTLDKHVSLQGKLLSDVLRKEFRDFSNVLAGKTVIRQCLSSRKVLIVLDDVDKDQQLEYLVGSRDWFGPGSRIIVTTRDERLLLSHRVYYVYKAETLNKDDALRLFRSKAFNGGTTPNSDLMRLSRRVVGYAGGLPLALNLWGSLFGGTDPAQWGNAIERLARESDNDIVDKLRISFDVLKQSTKDIFLDLACFLYHPYIYTKDFVMEILDGCKFFPCIGIDDLVKKSLVTIEEEGYGEIYIEMHDLLREMGRKIVRDESKEPGKRSRLWDSTDIKHVIRQNTATDAIECMYIDDLVSSISFWSSYETSNLIVDAFSKMKNLRLLNVNFSINCDHLNYLSNELRLFQWFGCRLRSFPPSFQPHNLVALIAEDSRIERLWEGTKRMDNLKRVNLGYSINLIETPDFSEAPNLEYLDFKYCTGLVFVHPSITVHKRVKLLDLGGCESIRSLPPEIRMESLEKLKLWGCSNLERFPKIVGKMESLLELHLSDCYKIDNWREMLRQAQLLSSLKVLRLSNCNLGEGDIPTEIGCLSSLEVLNLCGNPFNNCYRLAENKMNAETFLKKHKVFANSTEGLVDIIMPGSEIPEWFRGHERVESSSMKIPMPLTIRNGGQWMGVAFFCIFINPEGQDEMLGNLYFEARVCHRNSGEGVNFRIDHCLHRICPIRKDQIFLRYLSRARFSTRFESFGQEWDELEFSFDQYRYRSVKVKQCGFRMVYQKDLEDIQLREEQQYNNQGSAEFEDNNEDGSIASGSLVNRKRKVSEDDTEATTKVFQI